VVFLFAGDPDFLKTGGKGGKAAFAGLFSCEGGGGVSVLVRKNFLGKGCRIVVLILVRRGVILPFSPQVFRRLRREGGGSEF